MDPYTIIAVCDIVYIGYNIAYQCRVSPHFVALGMNHFSVIRRKLVHSLHQRILHSSNTLINSLVICNHFASSRIFNEWTEVLFSSPGTNVLGEVLSYPRRRRCRRCRRQFQVKVFVY